MREQSSLRLVLPFEAWPNVDQQMWVELVREGSLFNDAGALAQTRDTTRQTYRERYGRWLAWIIRAELPALAEPPVARATPERICHWLDSMSALSPASREAYVNGLLVILRAVAPEADWTLQKRLLAILRYHLRHGPQSPRKKGRVLSSTVLFDAGIELATETADRESTPLKVAKARRDGAMVALLACLPIRRRAFVELALGSSLLETKGGFHIDLTEIMTKTGRWWGAPVPERVVHVLRQYLNEVRPWFLSRGGQFHDTVWVDNRGAPYALDYFGMRIRSITGRTLGVRISPHLFRDAAATTLCRSSPKDAGLILALLGHASFETAERHYNHATSLEAGQEYAAVLDRLISSGKLKDQYR